MPSATFLKVASTPPLEEGNRSGFTISFSGYVICSSRQFAFPQSFLERCKLDIHPSPTQNCASLDKDGLMHDRREFLKVLSVAGAGAMLPAAELLAQQPKFK